MVLKNPGFCQKLKISCSLDHTILFYITIADADIGSLKSLHTLFDKYLYLNHMLVEFEQNCVVQTIQNFELSQHYT